MCNYFSRHARRLLLPVNPDIHIFGTVPLWYFFKQIKKKNLSVFAFSMCGFVSVLVYYLILM